MDWTQFAIFLFSVVGLFLWNRAEGRADDRHLEEQFRANRDLISSIHRECMEERRDFHGQLERQDAEFKAHLMNVHGK